MAIHLHVVQDFKDLGVWQRAHRLVLDANRICSPTAFAKHSSLRTQLIRAASSISANVAEGTAKNRREFARYLEISLGSTKELENHFLLARDLGLLARGDFEFLNGHVDAVRRMLISLSRRVRSQGQDRTG